MFKQHKFVPLHLFCQCVLNTMDRNIFVVSDMYICILFICLFSVGQHLGYKTSVGFIIPRIFMWLDLIGSDISWVDFISSVRTTK